jgi:hypothetical protein
MPRARPSSKADIAARRRAARPFSAETVAVPIEGSLPGTADAPGLSEAEAAAVETLLDRIAELAHAGSEQRPCFFERVKVLLQRYEAEKLADQQEHPKREIAAYKLVQAAARRLLKRLHSLPKRLRSRPKRLRLEADARRLLEQLQSLPEGLRLPLGAGNTESRLGELIGASATRFAAAIDNVKTQLDELVGNTGRELANLRSRLAPNRLANAASVQLRKGLLEVFAPYAPDDEAERDRRVAEALRLLGVRYPNEKKDRKRFQGRGRESPDSCTEKSERRR